MRNHTETPLIDVDTWALRIFGDGLLVPRDADSPVTVSYDDLRALPVTRLTTTLECTGNGRSFFTRQQGQQVPGTPWEMGGVAAVTWEGARLAEVFDRIGVRREAVSVMATGLDPRYVCEEGIDRGRVRRPFPVAKALDDALLVWGVNGEPLLPDHGFPLRLVLPGWVGIANIKWLGSLEVATTQLASPWSTEWYRMSGGDHPVDAPPLTTSPVRSAWELAADASLPAGRPLELTGRSWSGAGPDRPGRRERRRRPHLAAGRAGGAHRLDPVALHLARPAARRPRADGPCHRRRRPPPAPEHPLQQ